jgi:hypothetical protein
MVETVKILVDPLRLDMFAVDLTFGCGMEKLFFLLDLFEWLICCLLLFDFRGG